MGNCCGTSEENQFFLDDVYDRGKFPDAQGIQSIMNGSAVISDFDTLCIRIAWKKQRIILSSIKN